MKIGGWMLFLNTENMWQNFIIEEYAIWAMSKENLSSEFATREDRNQSAKLQRIARVLKFRV